MYSSLNRNNLFQRMTLIGLQRLLQPANVSLRSLLTWSWSSRTWSIATTPALSRFSSSNAPKDDLTQPVEFTSIPKEDKPVQYSSSNAFHHKVLHLDEDNSPKYQRPIILTSIAVFMLYFFVLREENDLDREMRKPLWERIPTLERQTLQALIEYNKKYSKSNAAAEARLAELIAKDEAAGRPESVANRRPANAPLLVAPVGPR